MDKEWPNSTPQNNKNSQRKEWAAPPIVGQGRGLCRWLEVMQEGVPPIGSPPDSPKATGEPMGRPMEEAEAAREVNSPSQTAAMADLDKMPPLEEDEAHSGARCCH